MLLKVAGKGYFVFGHLKCMQSGEYVENPFYDNAESIGLKNMMCSKLCRTLIRTDDYLLHYLHLYRVRAIGT